MSPAAEAFLDQAITWRELGFQNCAHQANYDRWESLPDWAKATLSAHASDPRPYHYSLAQFAAAATHDPLWNAAQRQLLAEGRIHNYLRMLWGKKILQWTGDPREALEVMVELNHRYALDGQDPNSYSGIFWILGALRSPLGAEAADLRLGSIHELRQRAQEASPDRLSPPLWTCVGLRRPGLLLPEAAKS